MRNHLLYRNILILSLSLLAGLIHSPAGAQATTPTAAKAVLTNGTEVKVTLKQDLKSGGSKVGQEVQYDLDRDLYSPFPSHILLVPAGTTVYGKVTRSSRRGIFGKAGKLEFSCDYILTPGGVKVPLRADKIGGSGRNNNNAAVLTGLFLFIPGFFVNGKDVEFHKGQAFTVYVDQDTALSPVGAPALADVNAAPAPAMTAPPQMVSAPSSQSLFTLKDGSQIVGSLLSFDSVNYVVATPSGNQIISASNVTSMHAITGATTSAVPILAPAAIPAPPVPRLPVITTFPQKVRMELTDGNSFIGNVTAFYGTTYVLQTLHTGVINIQQVTVKTLELLPNDPQPAPAPVTPAPAASTAPPAK